MTEGAAPAPVVTPRPEGVPTWTTGPASDEWIAASRASWGRRLVAWLLDSAVVGAVTWLALRVDGAGVSPTPVGWDATGSGPPSAVAWTTVALLLLLQALTGQTPGKRAAGVVVVDDVSARPVGILRTVLRYVAHVVDAVLLIGYLRPLWHRQGRTFADSMLGTVVVRRPAAAWGAVRPVLSSPRLTAAAVLVCVVAVGFTVPVASGGRGGVASTQDCAVRTEADVRASAEVDLVVTSRWQQRLWVREESATTDARVRWTWPAEWGKGRSIGIGATVRDATGDVVDEVHVLGTPAEYDGSPLGKTDGVADLSLPPGAWLVRSTLLLDDRAVAHCELASP